MAFIDVGESSMGMDGVFFGGCGKRKETPLLLSLLSLPAELTCSVAAATAGSFINTRTNISRRPSLAKNKQLS